MTETRLRPEPEVDPTFQMFASRSVPVHVVRGVLGLVAMVAGIALASVSGWWLLLLPLTVVLWRGCPTCWVMGLIATRGRAPACKL
ncbi:hypothetical protein [Nocardioides sp.]|uniref:hypothetical protein n=1 Tax=Nocardioides sp. TaxID=35761 RepID=UPI00271A45CC|nr:hypothetical protein [Nocardioides sp.]MDO9457531.1 hypothetical protein [Nocardioides sp.]